MTGAFLRAKRGDTWEPIEVEHLTDEERHEKFIGRTPEELVNWMNMLCGKIVQCEKLFNELVEEGILSVHKETPDVDDVEND